MEELFALIYTSERERGISHIPKEVARLLASYKGDDLYELLASSVCQSIFVEEGFPVVPLVMNELIEDLADYLRNDLFDRYAEICIAHKGCKQYSDEVFEKLGRKPPYYVSPELRRLVSLLAHSDVKDGDE